MFESPVRHPGLEPLRWLVRHRWLAVAGQTGAILVAVWVFGLRFEVWPVLFGLLVLALSNHFILPDDEPADGCGRRIGWVLAFDALLLTWILHWTGGRENPFVWCYLLNVVLAAMLLGRRGLLMVAILSGAGFAWLSLAADPFRGSEVWIEDGRLVPTLDALGRGIALVLIAAILGVLVYAMRRDMLAQERALQETQRLLSESERFKSLATLAAGVAHELGTPLGTIAVAAKELGRSVAAGHSRDDMADDAELIRSEVERCRVILRRLDRRSTGGTGSERNRFRLGEIEGWLIERLAGEHTARLQTRCTHPDAEVELPREAVLQSLVVLMENACEADTHGAPVRLSIDQVEDSVRFQVCDRGPGMSEHVRRRAGEPYFTTKGHDGSGLGLFLVRTLTLELGGEVRLDPVADGGTCAILTLPLIHPE